LRVMGVGDARVMDILALRLQLRVLQRQPGPDRVRSAPGDRALLAALLHRLPRNVLKRLHLCAGTATWPRVDTPAWPARKLGLVS
jgi:putative transposase